MILVDANLLLYAYQPQSNQHEASRAWLESILSGPELVRFAWLTISAFLRISTNPRAFERPFTTTEAEAAVAS
jgi:predicted nucleic acid-binding protein